MSALELPRRALKAAFKRVLFEVVSVEVDTKFSINKMGASMWETQTNQAAPVRPPHACENYEFVYRENMAS